MVPLPHWSETEGASRTWLAGKQNTQLLLWNLLTWNKSITLQISIVRTLHPIYLKMCSKLWFGLGVRLRPKGNNRPQHRLTCGKCACRAHRDRRGSCQIILRLKPKSLEMGFLCSVLRGRVVELLARRCVFQRERPPLWRQSKLCLMICSSLQVRTFESCSIEYSSKYPSHMILLLLWLLILSFFYRVGSSRK